MRILYSKYYLPLCFFYVVLVSCTEKELGLNNEDLVFSNSFQIQIPGYQYSDSEGIVYYVRGDTSFQASYPDTLNSMPVLAWDSIGMKIISVAIFISPIVTVNNDIVNTEDIVWKWDSGMDVGRKGYVQYTEGKSVIDGELVDNVTPLKEFTYYWGVWAWNSEGNRILYSSRLLEFYVLN